jgi:polysaccharide biosynthesis transport protein
MSSYTRGFATETAVTAHAGGKSAAVSTGLRFSIAGSVKQHRTLAFSIFLFLLIAGGLFAWIKGRPRYTATAVIFVSPRFVANLEDNKEHELQSNSEYREYVQQNVRTVNRFDIVQEAFDRLGLNRSLWQQKRETETHAIERLQHSLEIAPVPDTYQITVSLQSEHLEGLALIVNTVVDTYLTKMKAEEFYGTDQRIDNLQKDRAVLAKDIAEKQSRRAQLAEELSVSTFSDNFPNPYDHLVVDAKQSWSDATKQRIQAEAQLAALQMRSTSGAVSPLEANVLDEVNRDPALITLETSTNQRRGILLSSISGLAPEHPGRRAAERELKELEQEREKLYQQVLKSYAGTLLEQRSSDVTKAQQAELKLKDEAEKQSSQASWFTQHYQEALNLGAEIERERKRIDTIEDRIGFLSLESRAPGFVRLFSKARQPDMPSKGGRRKLALMMGLLSIAGAVLVPLSVDFLDPRIHWPGDVTRILGFPVLGWFLEQEDAGIEFAREQILRLAARISHEKERNGSTVFAFTAVQSGNGTSSVVRNLANALTGFGMPSLAVEANAYRSDAEPSLRPGGGLSVLLKGQSSLSEAVVSGKEGIADYLPVGSVQSRSNLPDLRRLVEILRQAADSYAVVLVDLPPITLSVDAEMVARSADVVIVVVEAETVTKAQLTRTAALLERAKPNAVAAVLNRVQLKAAAAFGEQARDEFYRGTPEKAKVWKSPWMWN